MWNNWQFCESLSRCLYWYHCDVQTWNVNIKMKYFRINLLFYFYIIYFTKHSSLFVWEIDAVLCIFKCYSSYLNFQHISQFSYEMLWNSACRKFKLIRLPYEISFCKQFERNTRRLTFPAIFPDGLFVDFQDFEKLQICFLRFYYEMNKNITQLYFWNFYFQNFWI